MKPERVLITGVAGFIGSHLLEYLLEHSDWHIHGIDNLSTGRLDNIAPHLKQERFEFTEASVTELRSVKAYRYIFHLAALPRIQPSFERVREHIEANVLAAVHLVELMVAEAHFPRLINSSSSAIYGTPTELPTPETAAVDCLSPYAFQKYEVERYLELLATRYPLDYVNLRYFNPYGPRSFNPRNPFNAYSSVVGIFLHRHSQGLPLQVTGDGSQRRDFIHVADLASANFLAATHPHKLNTAFNIGYGSTTAIVELARMISSAYEHIAPRGGEAEVTFANVAKAKEVLGWAPGIALADYLKETVHA